jgi:thiamine biosynthesis lipoprotein
MATRFELVLRGPDPVRLRAAGEAAIDRIEEAHRTFTRFEDSSLLAHLRRVAPRPVPLDADTLSLFAEALEVESGSDRAFSVVMDGTPGHRVLMVDPVHSTVALSGPEVFLDFGAIAKGFAVDVAAKAVRDAGVASAFIHGGTSSVLGIGRPVPNEGWRIALDEHTEPQTVELADLALSLSSTAARDHIRDPRGRLPVTVRRRALVIGPKASLADAWSTAAVVLGGRPPGMGAEWRLGIQEGDATWRWFE